MSISVRKIVLACSSSNALTKRPTSAGRPADVHDGRADLASGRHDPARPSDAAHPLDGVQELLAEDGLVEVRDGEPDTPPMLVVEDMSE
jgi:hypothetical protein